MSDFLYALSFYTDYADGGKAIVAVLCLLSIAYGILSCFYGYRIFKFITGVCGFIIGTILGFIIAIGTGGSDISGPALTVVSLLFGVLGAFLAVKLYFLGIFLIGALFGGLLAFVLTSSMDDGQGLIIILSAIIAGVLSVIIRKFMIILSTSVSGAQTISTALYILIFAVTGNEINWIKDLLWIVLAVIGFSYQYSSNKNAPVDPVAQTNSGISGLGSLGNAFKASKLYQYKKPLIIACIIILALLLFGPRMPFGLVLLIIAATIALYLFIDKKYGYTSAQSGGTVAFTAAAGNTGAAADGIAAAAGSTSNGSIECASCHAVNNAGSKFCGKCGMALGDNNTGSGEVTE